MTIASALRIPLALPGFGHIRLGWNDACETYAARLMTGEYYVNAAGLQIASEGVGDIYSRRVVYLPATGKVRVKRLRLLHANTIAEQEFQYRRRVEARPASGEIELF